MTNSTDNTNDPPLDPEEYAVAQYRQGFAFQGTPTTIQEDCELIEAARASDLAPEFGASSQCPICSHTAPGCRACLTD